MPPITEHEIFKRLNGRWGVKWRDIHGNYNELGNCETDTDAYALFIDMRARLQQIENGTLEGFDRSPRRPVTIREPRVAFPLMLSATEKADYMSLAKAKGMSLSAYIRLALAQQIMNKEVG